MFVCVWAKAREISQFLSTNLCKEHYCSPAVRRLKIKIWSSSASLSTVCELPLLVSHQINSPVDPESASGGVWSDWSACQSQSGSAEGGQGRQMLTDAVEPTAGTGAAMRRSHPALRRRANHWCTATNNTPMFVPRARGTVFPHVRKAYRESQPEDSSFIFFFVAKEITHVASH